MPPLPTFAPPSVPSTPFQFQFKPARQPMLWAALSYAGGIIAGTYLSRPASWWVLAGFAFLGASLYFIPRREWLATALALGALVFAGALPIQLRSAFSNLDTAIRPFAYGPEVEITAHVAREGRLREASAGELRQSLDVETEEILTDNGTRIRLHSGVRLGLYGDRQNASTPTQTNSPTERLFRYGERLRFPVKLKLPRNFRNSGAFDYEGYLAANGIAALGSVKAEDVQLLAG
ncbi:MAG: ComEC/Rec2 family competence protein, partial [Candidatus Sulfotelmatobacter sp.]